MNEPGNSLYEFVGLKLNQNKGPMVMIQSFAILYDLSCIYVNKKMNKIDKNHNIAWIGLEVLRYVLNMFGP